MKKIEDGVYRLKEKDGPFGPIFVKVEGMQAGCAFTDDWRSVNKWGMGDHNHWLSYDTEEEFYSKFICVSGSLVSLENK